MKPDFCQLCRKESKRLHGHHLSYEHEIIIYLCGACHSSVHHFGRLTEEQLNTAIQWISQYRDEWINGTQKFFKSEYYKKISREKNSKWRKENPQKAKEKSLRWQKKNPWKLREFKHGYNLKRRKGNQYGKTSKNQIDFDFSGLSYIQ